jgi:hypothetical protein
LHDANRQLRVAHSRFAASSDLRDVLGSSMRFLAILIVPLLAACASPRPVAAPAPQPVAEPLDPSIVPLTLEQRRLLDE